MFIVASLIIITSTSFICTGQLQKVSLNLILSLRYSGLKSETISQQETLTTKSVEYLDSIAQADSIKASINKTIDVTTVKKDAPFYTDQKKEAEIATKPTYTEFNIIAGSFQSRNKARDIFQRA
ncbi:MAG: hypothetical protein MZV63_19060 [Marinilabiliales bacterium]|nr:hypothetical protein [Marinilabiliales bacterium]